MEIIHWNALQDGRFTEQALREKLEALGYQVSRYTYPPGTYFPDHTHTIDKIDAVVSGRFRISTPKGVAILEEGDALTVPRGTLHSAEVIGTEPVISLDATRG